MLGGITLALAALGQAASPLKLGARFSSIGRARLVPLQYTGLRAEGDQSIHFLLKTNHSTQDVVQPGLVPCRGLSHSQQRWLQRELLKNESTDA